MQHLHALIRILSGALFFYFHDFLKINGPKKILAFRSVIIRHGPVFTLPLTFEEDKNITNWINRR